MLMQNPEKIDIWLNVKHGKEKQCLHSESQQHFDLFTFYHTFKYLWQGEVNSHRKSARSTACVNKSASLKEHFFLRKRYVSFVKAYNNMIGNIISFYKIFVLCNLYLWFGNYGKSCEVRPNLFGLIH